MKTASNSRVLRTIPLLVAFCLVNFSAQAQYGGGTGEPNDPYLISTAEQMNAIGANPGDWNKHFKLMADIDLGSYTGTDFNIIGDFFDIINPFTGVFDGNGKTISNFRYTSEDTYYIGLFVCVIGKNARIKDLGLIDPNIDAGRRSSIGSLVGKLGGLREVTGIQGGTITNCYVEGGSISGWDAVGGLVGGSDLDGIIVNCYVKDCNVSGNDAIGGLAGGNYGNITNCYVKGSKISGVDAVGGLVGGNELHGTIVNCYVEGGNSSGRSYIGGLVGGNAVNSEITNCYSTGSVSGSGTRFLKAGGGGGLVGENYGTITNCTASASVLGTDYAGGLVGNNYGTIANCRAASSVSGSGAEQFGQLWPCGVGGLAGHNGGIITTSYSIGTAMGNARVGGLVGWNSWEGTVTNCYSSGNVSGDELVGGLVGENSSIVGLGTFGSSFWDIETSGYVTSSGGLGKTTAEMKKESTFTEAGWDFVGESINGIDDIWSICEGTNYPRLVLQIPAGDFDCPDGTTVEDFLFFIEHWGNDNCDIDNDYCQGTDLDSSGTVDTGDLEILIETLLKSRSISPPQPPVPPPPVPPSPPPKARGCFPAYTPVWINGELVLISDVLPGQLVGELHFDPEKERLELIEKIEEHEGAFECRDIVLESGSHISVVDSHCFMLESGLWIAAQDLRSGLRLRISRGTVGIKSVATRAVPFVGRVYNLKIENSDKYLVGKDAVIVRDY